MIRALTEADIPGLNRLPPAEWKLDYEKFLRRFISEDFFSPFVLVKNNQIVATGSVLLKNKIGWLANIIVDSNFRGKGFGLAITQHLVSYLNAKGCQTQLLIATDLGARVYTKLGFEKISDYQSFDSGSGYDFKPSKAIRPLQTSDLATIITLDTLTNDENRAHLITNCYQTGFGYFNDKNEFLGFYLPDFAKGLVLSTDQTAGFELLKLKHAKAGKRTLLPVENQEGIHFLESLGLQKGEKSARMILGKENHWNPTYIYSYGSGYCG